MSRTTTPRQLARALQALSIGQPKPAGSRLHGVHLAPPLRAFSHAPARRATADDDDNQPLPGLAARLRQHDQRTRDSTSRAAPPPGPEPEPEPGRPTHIPPSTMQTGSGVAAASARSEPAFETPSTVAGIDSILSHMEAVRAGGDPGAGLGAGGGASSTASMSDLAQELRTQPIGEPYHLHVYSHRHNTHVTVTHPNRNAIVSLSCGNIGFRKSGRKHFDSAYQLASHVLTRLHQRGWYKKIDRLEVVLRGFGPGRDAVIKVLMGNEGRLLRDKIVRVSDSTRIKFGGTRSKKPRRLG